MQGAIRTLTGTPAAVSSRMADSRRLGVEARGSSFFARSESRVVIEIETWAAQW